MNHNKEKALKNSNEPCLKSCLKVKGTPERNASGGTSRKYAAHSGIKFNFNKKKVTTVKPFSFDKPCKTEKETAGPSREKSDEIKVDTEKSDFSDARGQVHVVMDTLKISTSTENTCTEKSPLKEKRPKSPSNHYASDKKPCTRCSKPVEGLQQFIKDTKEKCVEKSPLKEKTPKTLSKDHAREKKPCSRCSRNANSPQPTRKGKDEVKPLKVAKSQEQSLKTAKPQIQQSSKIKSPAVCPRMAKIKETKSEMTSNAVKPKSISNNADRSEVNPRDKNICTSEKLECTPSKLPSLETNGKNPEVGSSKAEVSEFVAYSSENHESYTEKIILINGTRLESELCIVEEPESELLNGTSTEFEHSNGISSESSTSKSVSKIPRFGAPAGQKIPTYVKKEANLQPLIVEN